MFKLLEYLVKYEKNMEIYHNNIMLLNYRIKCKITTFFGNIKLKLI